MLSLHYLFLFLVIPLFAAKDEEQTKNIKVWHDKLLAFFNNKTSNDSTLEEASRTFNQFEPWDNCTDPNMSYYLFLVQTKINFTQEIELRSYFGLCLEKYKPTDLELIDLTYTILWEKNNLIHSLIYDIEEPFIEEKGYPTRAVFLIFLIVVYVIFNVYVSKFPKYLSFKTNSEMERIQETIETDMRKRFIDDDTNTNNDNVKNDFTLAKNINYNSLFEGSVRSSKNNMSNKNVDEDRKERKIFYSKIYNSFNLKQNIRLIFSSKFSFFNLDNDPELNVACGLRAIAYLWVALYSVLPIIFKIPISNPQYLIQNSNNFFGQIIYNGHFQYNMIFGLNGFIVAYTYIKGKKNFTLQYVLLETVFAIAEFYFVFIIVYFIYWQTFILFNDGPVSRYLYNNECESCDKQMMNMLMLTANLTYGLYEKFFPFCLYHCWILCTGTQYYIGGVLLVWLFSKFKSLFYVFFMLLTFNIFILHIMTLGSTPVTVTYLDMIYRNLKPFYGLFGLKLITRAGPFIFGLFFGVFYMSKEEFTKGNFISYIQHRPIFCLSIGFCVFWLVYYMQFLMINNYITYTEIFTWVYSLIKHDVFTLSFLTMLISVLSNNKICIKIKNFFNCHTMIFIQKISVSFYIIMAVIARGVFFRHNAPISITNLELIELFAILWVMTLIVSIIFTALFQVPFIRIGITVKSSYEEMIKSNSISLASSDIKK